MSEKTELEVYLSQSRLDRLVYPELDVLEYWKKEKVRFPILSVLARDLLSIPVTTVASESSFSIGGRILNKYRSALLSVNFEALILTRNWVEGFEAPGMYILIVLCIFYFLFVVTQAQLAKQLAKIMYNLLLFHNAGDDIEDAMLEITPQPFADSLHLDD